MTSTDPSTPVVLEEGGVGLVKLGYKVSDDQSLDDIERRAQTFGASVERMSKGDNLGVGDGVRITLPSEHTLELYSEIEYLGTETGLWNPDPWPRSGLRGIGVPRLDHTLITTEDPQLLERFFEEAMDFRAAERLVGGPDNTELVASWMFCGDQPHDIAFTKGPNSKLHHFAYHMPDWSSLLHAGDVMSMYDVPIDFGPARHGITRGETIYFFDPSGNRNEVFSGGYRTGKDWRTITWTMDQRPAASTTPTASSTRTSSTSSPEPELTRLPRVSRRTSGRPVTHGPARDPRAGSDPSLP